MFLFAFSIFLILISIYSIYKKKFHLVFFPCILFLPDYYGFEVSDSLPIITVTRLMFIVFYIYALFVYRHNISSARLKALVKSPAFLLLTGYLSIRIIANLYYIRIYSQPIKTLFILIFEQILLLLAVFFMNLDRKELLRLIKAIVYVSVAMFLLGIIESLTGIRITNQLYTVHRYVLNAHYVRLGLLRSTVTMSLPGLYGNFCVLILPAILYLYEKERLKRYLLFIALDIFACVHSGTRSSLLFLIAIIAVTFILNVSNIKRLTLFIKNAAIVLLCSVLVVGLLSFASNRLSFFYSGSAKAVLNEVGFNFDLDEGAPEGVSGFGSNSDGTASRASQFSGIRYALSINPIFGLGSGAQNRGQIMYYWKSSWRFFHTYDIGYVEMLCDEGILGGISFLLLICAISVLILKGQPGKEKAYSLIWIVSYLLCLLSTINMYSFLFMFISVLIAKTAANNE